MGHAPPNILKIVRLECIFDKVSVFAKFLGACMDTRETLFKLCNLVGLILTAFLPPKEKYPNLQEKTSPGP